MSFCVCIQLENIGKRTDKCTRKSVLNCISDYPADWASIGTGLIGPELVEKIKQDTRLPGDEVAYLVEEWWRKTLSVQFSWQVLQDAILKVAESKYGQRIHYSDSILSDEDNCKYCQYIQSI